LSGIRLFANGLTYSLDLSVGSYEIRILFGVIPINILKSDFQFIVRLSLSSV